MNKIAMIAMGAFATMGMTTAATAETWTPASTTSSLSGALQVSKLLGPFNCGVSGSITTPAGSGNASLTSLALTAGDSTCTSITFTGGPWAVEGVPGSPKKVKIKNLGVTGITGNCKGDLEGTYLGSGQIQFVNVTLPRTSGLGDCKINGTIATSPALDFS